MRVQLLVQYNEIERDSLHSTYNHICWKLNNPKFGLEYLVEVYDDVSDFPDYKLGIIRGGKFVHMASGEGDPIDEGYLGFGGVWLKVDVNCPEHFIKFN